MFTRHARLITIVLAVAVLVVLGGSTVLAQGPSFPTPVPPTKAPATQPTSAAPKVAPTVAPAAPGTKSGPAITVPTVKPAQPAAQPRTGAKVVPAPGGPFASAFRVQNLGTATASCSYIFYDAAGAAQYTSTATSVNVGDSMFVYTPSLSSSTFVAGQYSGVVSCDQQVAAIVNFSQPLSVGANSSGDNYAGITTPTTTWYAPALYNNYYNFYTNIVVQNATGSAVNVHLDIFPPGSSTAVYTADNNNVPGYASTTFDQSGLSQLATNVSYSAKITATGNVAPIVNIYGQGPYAWELYSYNPLAAGSTTVYAPVILNNFYGYNSAMSIQNIGTGTATVHVVYGTGQTFDGTIAAGSSTSLYTPASGVPAGTATGATITSTGGTPQPLVVLVNQSNSVGRAASYTGFAAGAKTVRLPIAFRRYFAFNSATQCQNVGANPTKMTISYGGVSGSFTTPSNVAVGATYQFYQGGDPLLVDGWSGSATVTAAENIVCVVNEDQNEGSAATTYMDQFYSYDGIGQ